MAFIKIAAAWLIPGLFLLAPLSALAADIPNAPVPAERSLRPVDYALLGNIAAGRAMDFASTEKCVRNSARNGCHEKLLPNALVHNRAAFAAFEIGTASLSAFSEYEGVRHGHRKAARLIALAVGAGIDAVAAHNFALAGRR